MSFGAGDDELGVAEREPLGIDAAAQEGMQPSFLYGLRIARAHPP